MSIQRISAELLKIFQNEIAAVHDLPYRVMNDSRDNPNADVWAMVSIVEDTFDRQAFGSTYNVYEDIGIFTVQLFSPMGTGTKHILELAEAIRDVYNDRYVRPSGMDIRLPYPDIAIIGRVNDYYQVNVAIDFSAQVEKSKL